MPRLSYNIMLNFRRGNNFLLLFFLFSWKIAVMVKKSSNHRKCVKYWEGPVWLGGKYLMRWAPQVIPYLKPVNNENQGRWESSKYSVLVLDRGDRGLFVVKTFRCKKLYFLCKKNYFVYAQYGSEMAREMKIAREMGDGDSWDKWT
jgi:hypothetical protein